MKLGSQILGVVSGLTIQLFLSSATLADEGAVLRCRAEYQIQIDGQRIRVPAKASFPEVPLSNGQARMTSTEDPETHLRFFAMTTPFLTEYSEGTIIVHIRHVPADEYPRDRLNSYLAQGVANIANGHGLVNLELAVGHLGLQVSHKDSVRGDRLGKLSAVTLVCSVD